MTASVAGLELSGWSLRAFRKSLWLKRAASGAEQAALSQLYGAGMFTSVLLGMFFTILPLWVHLRGLLEVLLQSLFLSLLLFYWVNHPEKRWLNWALGILFFILLAFPILGLLVTRPTPGG